MTAWTRLPQVRQRLEKRWQKGDLLRDLLDPDGAYPWRIALKKPSPRDLTDRLDDVRAWAQHWQQQTPAGLTVEWQTTNHRQLGRNALPVAVVLDTPAAALRLTGHQREGQRFLGLFHEITGQMPALAAWCQRNPLRVLEQETLWPRWLDLITYLQACPKPGIYLRQLDLPGLHTKLIEQHRGLLMELLEPCLPPDAINDDATGARQFETRYGFRTRPVRVRLRLLDPDSALQGLQDLSIPVDDFARLKPPVKTVVIVENDITALAFPFHPDTLVIFGQGYGVDQLLASADWLHDRPVWYWGDIDTHGFAILDQLRTVLPHARSLRMDLATLQQHPDLWGQEGKPTNRALPRLTKHEQAVYQGLVDNRWGDTLRLEQERLPLGVNSRLL